MGPDYYKVEVLHALNPHLIWVLVRDNSKLALEQIGMYGILPLNMTIDIGGKVTTESSVEWMPSALAAMQDWFNKAHEVWFSPTYIDKKTSVFDDNSHKYGDIIIKLRDGRPNNLIDIIADTGAAIQDECLFHQQLSNNNLKTKLNYVTTTGVLTKLKDAYNIVRIPKNQWEAAVNSQMSVSLEAVKLEAALTGRNLEAKDRENSQILLQNKLNDLKLCKDIDEESAGRANSHCGDASSVLSLRKRLSFLRVKNNDTIDIKPDAVKGKDYAQLNTNINDNNFYKNNTNVDTLPRKVDDKDIKPESVKEKDYAQLNPNINDKNLYKNNANDTLPRKIDELQNKVDGRDDENEKPSTSLLARHIRHKKDKKSKPDKKSDQILVGFGPPGVDLKHILLKPKHKAEFEPQESSKLKIAADETDTTQNMFSKEDSVVNAKPTNSNSLKMKLKSFVNKQATNENVSPKASPTIENDTSKQFQNVGTVSPKPGTNTMKHRLELLKEKMIKAKMNDSFSSTSDKEYLCKQSDLDSDTESLTSLVNKLDFNNPIYNKEIEMIESKAETKKNYVNPFKNVDGSQSVFVENLVSPTLMVHTKKGNRIQPFSNLRDVPFGTDIHIVLRNMSIKSPMRPQRVSWPTILRGHSLFLISPYASGKTIGYLPAVCRLVSDNKDIQDQDYGLTCVILCATSNSVCNVEDMCKLFMHKEKIFACYSGMTDMYITTSLLNGCDILICTPTMFVRLLQGEFSIDLKNVSTFVIDDCERISEVYKNELKYSISKVKETVKSRVNKELKVQYILASRIWCDFMTPLAKKVPDTVICISAFQECVLYSEAKTSVDFVQKENKVESVLEFLKDINASKKTFIACKSDDEVKLLEKTLTQHNYVVFACDSTMNVQDLYAIGLALRDYQEPVIGPILVCCDDNLSHLNVSDANYLIHYSLPDLFSMFSKRFAVLIDNYQSIFKSPECEVKIKILLEDCNALQLPKILHFIKRCTDNIPSALNEISSKILIEKDYMKAEKLVPLCKILLTLGKCPDFWNCKERHTIFKDYDQPKQWMPKEGVINFHILHYNSAVNYSARLLSNITTNETKKYPQKYSLLTLKMGMHYSKESNKKLLGIPKVGDVCAVTLKQNLFVRCQVIKILKTTPNGQPHILLINLIDEEKYEMVRDTCLYYLPDELKNIETHVAKVVLANIMPRDRDISYSDIVKHQFKKITEQNEDIYLRGKICLVIGNHIFVDTLEVCQELSSLGETIVKNNLREELLDGHGMPNSEQIDVLKEMCVKVFDTNEEKDVEIPSKTSHRAIKKAMTKFRWAHLEGDFSSVFFLSAQSPEKFFIRLTKFKDCINSLLQDMKKHVGEVAPLEDIKVGDIVIAEFPDDTIFERARVDDLINDSKVKCFFVDQGDWRDVSVNKLYPIKDRFITQLPFQAIECRLVGVRPVGRAWTDFETNWLVDSCFDNKGDLKYLYAKYFTKETAESTDGNKYGVVLLDTYGEDDVVINNLIIDHNLAKESDEIEFLKNINFKKEGSKGSDMEWSHDSSPVTDSDSNRKQIAPPSRSTLGLPIRSFPLVGSDEEDDDKWCIENPKNFTQIMNSFLQKVDVVKENDDPVKIKELSPDTDTQVEDSDPLNKPKILWRQNKKNIVIKIQLTVESTYEVTIKDNSLKFYAIANETKYGFEIELYGVVDVKKSSYSNKGLYIQVILKKIININWLTLTRDSSLAKWIVYDVDNIDVSSEGEDEQYKDGLKNIVSTNADTDSDDDFFDDANF